MDIVNPKVEDYLRELQSRHSEPVLEEMEAYAAEHNFPIVGRMVGPTLEILAKSVRAQRMIELGSGFGYSAYWFSRAVGFAGQLFLTDSEEDNAAKAMDYLGRAALDGPVLFTVGDALETFASLQGPWDVVYNDIDKEGYPDAWRLARDRIRVGGMYLCDNVLWSGRVTEPEGADTNTAAILEHNAMIVADERFLTTVLPIRDGVMVALRVR